MTIRIGIAGVVAVAAVALLAPPPASAAGETAMAGVGSFYREPDSNRQLDFTIAGRLDGVLHAVSYTCEFEFEAGRGEYVIPVFESYYELDKWVTCTQRDVAPGVPSTTGPATVTLDGSHVFYGRLINNVEENVQLYDVLGTGESIRCQIVQRPDAVCAVTD